MRSVPVAVLNIFGQDRFQVPPVNDHRSSSWLMRCVWSLSLRDSILGAQTASAILPVWKAP